MAKFESRITSEEMRWCQNAPQPIPPEGDGWVLQSCNTTPGPEGAYYFHFCWQREARAGVVRKDPKVLYDCDSVREELNLVRAELNSYEKLHPLASWHEDDGPAMWWSLPIQETPYVGSPTDDDFPDFVTHWSKLLVPNEPDGASK